MASVWKIPLKTCGRTCSARAGLTCQKCAPPFAVTVAITMTAVRGNSFLFNRNVGEVAQLSEVRLLLRAFSGAVCSKPQISEASNIGGRASHFGVALHVSFFRVLGHFETLSPARSFCASAVAVAHSVSETVFVMNQPTPRPGQREFSNCSEAIEIVTRLGRLLG